MVERATVLGAALPGGTRFRVFVALGAVAGRRLALEGAEELAAGHVARRNVAGRLLQPWDMGESVI